MKYENWIQTYTIRQFWPLERVRYTGENGQNIWDFPRPYVDGSSWVWKYAASDLRTPGETP